MLAQMYALKTRLKEMEVAAATAETSAKQLKLERDRALAEIEMERASNPMAVLDHQGKVLLWNTKAVLGTGEALGRIWDIGLECFCRPLLPHCAALAHAKAMPTSSMPCVSNRFVPVLQLYNVLQSDNDQTCGLSSICDLLRRKVAHKEDNISC